MQHGCPAHPVREGLLVGLSHAVEGLTQLVLLVSARVQMPRPACQTKQASVRFGPCVSGTTFASMLHKHWHAAAEHVHMLREVKPAAPVLWSTVTM